MFVFKLSGIQNPFFLFYLQSMFYTFQRFLNAKYLSLKRKKIITKVSDKTYFQN